jgi:hypothetical protein
MDDSTKFLFNEMDALEALARKATPGPWQADGDCEFFDGDDYTDEWVRLGPDETAPFANMSSDGTADGKLQARANCDYIAACSPERVLALLARVRELVERR